MNLTKNLNSLITKAKLSVERLKDSTITIQLTQLQQRSDLTSIEILLRAANFYYKSGEYASALKFIDSALEIEPMNVEALITKGLIYLKLSDYVSANVHVNQALQFDPTNLEALHVSLIILEHLYHLSVQQGNYPTAATMLRAINQRHQEIYNAHGHSEVSTTVPARFSSLVT